MAAPRILAFAGSTRAGSFNKQLVAVAAAGARAAGAEVTVVDLAELPMPLFEEDTEARDGMPANAARLKELMIAHDGLLISSPEYNSSITAVLKNALDWASRGAPGEPPLAAFDGKTAALLAASPGSLGGLRGLVHLRAILGNVRVLVIPEQVAVARAHEAFDADGALRDAKQRARVEAVGARLAEVTARLRA